MKVVVDLFSGTGSATKAFEEAEDWEVFRVELLEKFEADLHRDIGGMDPNKIEDEEIAKAIRETPELKPEELPEEVDVVWASPPCTKFSIAGLPHHWEDAELPRSEEVVEHIKVAYRTLFLIQKMQPEYWFVENPRGFMRKVLPKEPQGTVTYCQFGHSNMKPTDLFGEHPESFEYKSCSNGDDCHEEAPRGSSGGLQGKNPGPDRSKVPAGLSEAILEAVENPEAEKNTSLERWTQ